MSLALSILSLLPIPLMILIATLMWRRKQHRTYPIFWSYLCIEAAGLVLESICKGISYKAFFYAYWGSSFLDLILELLLLRDVFSRTLTNYPQLDTFRRSLLEIVLPGLCAAAIVAILIGNGVQTLSKGIATADFVMNLAEVTLFIFVATSAIVLGIRWKTALCGMAAGLGIAGTANAAAFLILIRSFSLSSHVTIASWVNTLGYDLAIGIFAFYFLPKPKEVALPKKVRPELLGWAESMRGSLPR